MMSKDGKDLMVDCCCGCDNGLRIRIDKDEDNFYSYFSYTSGNWYKDQDETTWRIFCKKLKKIWAIIRNKDFYYSDIMMTQKDFEEFRGYINSIGSQEHDSAEWVKDETGIYVCSHCGVACPHIALENVIEYWNCNYCPNCGEPINK